jgi:hypothetical protein
MRFSVCAGGFFALGAIEFPAAPPGFGPQTPKKSNLSFPLPKNATSSAITMPQVGDHHATVRRSNIPESSAIKRKEA